MPNTVSFGTLVDPEEQEIARRRQYAEMLRQQSSEPIQAATVGGMLTPISPLQGVAKLAQALAARRQNQELDERQQALQQRRATEGAADVQAMVRALRGAPAQAEQAGNNPSAYVPAQEAQAPDPNRALQIALASRNPMLQQMGGSLLQRELMPKNVVVGRSLVNQDTGKVVGTDSTWQGEQQAAREAREAEAAARREEAQRAERVRLDEARRAEQARFDQQRQMAQLAASLRPAPQPHAPVVVEGPNGPMYADPRQAIGMRPANSKGGQLPASALRMQQDDLDAIGVAANLSNDVKALDQQIARGDLKIGSVQNLISAGRNMAGISDENSRNYASFRATLERMRNDSLRLNKGVQTEGDAQRAWNELIANANDPGVVRQRLREIDAINQRAVNQRRMNIDLLRQNFNAGPLDTTPFTNQPAAVGGGGATAQPAAGGFRIIGVQ